MAPVHYENTDNPIRAVELVVSDIIRHIEANHEAPAFQGFALRLRQRLAQFRAECFWTSLRDADPEHYPYFKGDPGHTEAG